MSTPTEMLRAAARADAARPRLTWYDQASGERVELSGTSLVNWVAKTAHLLDGEMGLAPGGAVAIDLPRHWLTAVWWLAVDAVGGSPHLGPDSTAEVAVFGPAGLDRLPDNDELVAVSLQPMGAAFAGALPTLVRDYIVEVRSQPDHYSGHTEGDPRAGRLAVEQASSWGLTPKDRVAAAGPWQDPQELTAELVAPLAANCSVVWIRNPRATDLVSLLVAEGATAWLGAPPVGLTLPPTIRLLGRSSVS
jgi:uncharacterized protein (TIGR03089 family)